MPKKFSKESLRVIVDNEDVKAMNEVTYSDLCLELNYIIHHNKLTFIQYTCALQRWKFVEKIAQQYAVDIQTDINDQAKFGSVLFLAVMKNLVHTARVLLEAGC